MAEGNINIQSSIVPNNENPRMPVTESKYVKGAPQTFATIEEMVAYHPALMKQGVPFTVMSYPRPGVITEFRLNRNPTQLLDASNNSIVTVNNYRDFYDVAQEINTAKTRVYQYAPDGPGGGAPVYPYQLEDEGNWSNQFDEQAGHKWVRFRDDDADDNEDGIYDNWTVPIPAGTAFTPGDYVENRFKRQAINTTIRNSTTGLEAGKFYVVQSGSLTITGDLSLNDIGIYITTSQSINLGIGRVFKYSASNAYVFVGGATVIETVAAPPRVLAGLPNNEPTGWTDDIPAGSDQLWQITGQKSVYGQLKSDWLIKKVNENPDFIRYNNSTTPHPDTIVNTSTAATDGSGGDTALIAAGWVSVYNQQDYMATREDAGGGLYTTWTVRKINNESGEFKDRVFKLFDLNLDFDDVVLAPPTTSDPQTEGWSDVPLEETDTQINYISEAIRYFDRSLKTPWSNPVPYTGKSIFNDLIVSDLGSAFKYDQLGAVTPSQIGLRANLYKGTTELWQNNVITYTWRIVYNGGSVVNVAPTDSSGDNFYKLAASGTPGDPAYIRADQRVVIKPGAIDGNAVIRCTQTLAMAQGDDIVFVEEFGVQDITDGRDAKNLAISVENGLVIYDTVNTVFNPTHIRMRAYQSNLVSPTYHWYRRDGGSWTKVSGTPPTGYSFSSNLAEIDLTTAGLFDADATAEEARFAVSTHATDPDLADRVTTFSDYVTVSKTSSNAVGQDGEPALSTLLTNEAHIVVIDADTGDPVAGEIGSTGRALTTLSLYEGATKQVYGGGNDYTIGVASDNAGIVFDFAANGDDVDIFVDTWDTDEISAVCTITITFGAKTLIKTFSVSSFRDAPGAILLDVTSNKGFEFTPQDRTNKTLTAKLYDTSLTGTQEITLPDSLWTFRWNVAGVWSSPSTTNTRTLTRADILVSYDITVEVYYDGDLFKSLSFRVNDIIDGKAYRLYADDASAPAAPIASVTPAGNATWTPSATDAIWAVDGYENPTTPDNYIWGTVYRIKGESGSQGDAGGFSHYMYKVSSTLPALGAGGNTSSLAQMQAAGWQSARPASGIIWQTQRYWIGQGVTFNGSGDPSTNPMTGSVWAAPIQIIATEGGSGDPGEDGDNGWSPVYALVNRGATDKVHQLVDWINGEGTKPGGIGQYSGPSGLTADINLATNLAGVPVEMRYNSGKLQWKYVTEGSGAWRDLVNVAPPISYLNGGSTADVAFAPGAGSVLTPGLTIPALSYNRRVEVRGKIKLRSDTVDNDDYFDLRLIRSVDGGGNVGFTDITQVRPVVVGASKGESFYLFGDFDLLSGESALVSISCGQYGGGSARFLGLEISAKVYAI